MAEDPNNDGRFWSRVLRRIRRADPQDAEDALQAAWLRLERYRAERQQPVRNVEAFLVKAANNIAIDGRRRAAFQSAQPVEIVCAGMADGAPLQDEVIEARNRLAHVEEGLARLTPRTREIFLMHRLDGLKYREIADQLGISMSAVEKHVARAALFLASWAKSE